MADMSTNEQARIRIHSVTSAILQQALDDKEEEVYEINQDQWLDQSSMQPPPMPSIHPTVKANLVGKAPPTGASTPRPADNDGVTGDLHPSSSLSSGIVNLSLQMKLNSVAADSRKAAQRISPKKEVFRGRASHCKIGKKIVIGNVAKLTEMSGMMGEHLYKWVVFVTGPQKDPPISEFISKVIFMLDKSYAPNDVIDVKSFPFHLTRVGWGTFPVRIQVHFKDQRIKPQDFLHTLVEYTVSLLRDTTSTSPGFSHLSSVNAAVEHSTTRHCLSASDVGRRERFLECSRELSAAQMSADSTSDIPVKVEPSECDVTSNSDHFDESSSEVPSLPVSGESWKPGVRCSLQDNVNSCPMIPCSSKMPPGPQPTTFCLSMVVKGAVLPALSDASVMPSQTDVGLSIVSSACSAGITPRPNIAPSPLHTSPLKNETLGAARVNHVDGAAVVGGPSAVSDDCGGVASFACANRPMIVVSCSGSSASLPSFGHASFGNSNHRSETSVKSVVSCCGVARSRIYAQSVVSGCGKPVCGATFPPLVMGNSKLSSRWSAKPMVIDDASLSSGRSAKPMLIGSSNVGSLPSLKPVIIGNGGYEPSMKPIVICNTNLVSRLPLKPSQLGNGNVRSGLPAKPLVIGSGNGASVKPLVSGNGNIGSRPSMRPVAVVTGRSNRASAGHSLLLRSALPHVRAMMLQRQKVQQVGQKSASTAVSLSEVVCNRPLAALGCPSGVTNQPSVIDSSPCSDERSDSSILTVTSADRPFACGLSSAAVGFAPCRSRPGADISGQGIVGQLAKARATLRSRHPELLPGRALTQRARQKKLLLEMNGEDAVPGKRRRVVMSRSAGWFSNSPGCHQDTGHTSADDEDFVGLSVATGSVGVVPGKKILGGLKPKVTFEPPPSPPPPIPSMSIRCFAGMESMVKEAALRHPLIGEGLDKEIHPYVAKSLEQWNRWHSAKRISCEWMRASSVRRYLQRHLEADDGSGPQGSVEKVTSDLLYGVKVGGWPDWQDDCATVARSHDAGFVRHTGDRFPLPHPVRPGHDVVVPGGAGGCRRCGDVEAGDCRRCGDVEAGGCICCGDVEAGGCRSCRDVEAGTCLLFKGEKLWSRKRIMLWCRSHALSPNGPGGCLLLDSSDNPDADHAKPNVEMLARCGALSSLSPPDATFAHFPTSSEATEVGLQPLNVERVDGGAELPPSALHSRCDGANVEDDGVLSLPTSLEAVFVQDTARQVGVKLSATFILPGVCGSVAEDMLFVATLLFAQDVVLFAAPSAFTRNRQRPHITSVDVHAALRTMPNGDVFTNRNCGVVAPDAPAVLQAFRPYR